MPIRSVYRSIFPFIFNALRRRRLITSRRMYRLTYRWRRSLRVARDCYWACPRQRPQQARKLPRRADARNRDEAGPAPGRRASPPARAVQRPLSQLIDRENAHRLKPMDDRIRGVLKHAPGAGDAHRQVSWAGADPAGRQGPPPGPRHGGAAPESGQRCGQARDPGRSQPCPEGGHRQQQPDPVCSGAKCLAWWPPNWQ